MTTTMRAAVLAVASLGFALPAWADDPDDTPKVKFEIRRAETRPAEGLVEAAVPGTKEKIYLHREADATNKDIADASVTEDPRKKPAVEVVFTKDGAKRMAAMSERHIDKPVAILVDGKVVSAPVIKGKFAERAVISGEFTKEEAERIVKGLGGK
jgi:preprotein translocase subunit SecD